ncbi:MAG TPA: hypothetical protein VHM88_13570, partial [Candidatus Acidoferrales bacterium]|nr:hypothetical protein [Candidatus Acidoferrales bacterium]
GLRRTERDRRSQDCSQNPLSPFLHECLLPLQVLPFRQGVPPRQVPSRPDFPRKTCALYYGTDRGLDEGTERPRADAC